jgi:hypothetical protein
MISKVTAMVNLAVLSQHSTEETEDNHETLSQTEFGSEYI